MLKFNILYIACACAAVATVTGCTTPQTVSRTGTVRHVVVCWLKEPGNVDARRQIIAASHRLADIPGVVSVTPGTMLPSTRPIVDSTFDVAIVMVFPDQQTMNEYLVHPQHQKAVREILQPLVKKILVYDFVTE